MNSCVIVFWRVVIVFGIAWAWTTSLARCDEAPASFALPEKTDRPARLTIEQIRDSLRAYYASLSALEVEYKTSNRSQELGDQLIPVLNMHFAMKGEKRYRAQSVDGVGPDDPAAAQALTLAYDGAVEQSLIPVQKRASIVKQKQQITDQDAYVQALAIPVTDSERASVASSAMFLPYALDSPDRQWHVEPELEKFDGAECHVLVERKSQQRILVDEKLGCAMRFREIRQQIPEPVAEGPPLHSRYAFSKYQKCNNELWLPMRIDIVEYVSNRQPRDLWNRPFIESSHVAKRIALNSEVQDALFTLRYPPGTEVRDFARGKYYRIGDAQREVDMLLEEGSKELVAGRSSFWIWLLIANGVLVLGGLGVYVFRSLGKRRSSR